MKNKISFYFGVLLLFLIGITSCDQPLGTVSPVNPALSSNDYDKTQITAPEGSELVTPESVSPETQDSTEPQTQDQPKDQPQEKEPEPVVEDDSMYYTAGSAHQVTTEGDLMIPMFQNDIEMLGIILGDAYVIDINEWKKIRTDAWVFYHETDSIFLKYNGTTGMVYNYFNGLDNPADISNAQIWWADELETAYAIYDSGKYGQTPQVEDNSSHRGGGSSRPPFYGFPVETITGVKNALSFTDAIGVAANFINAILGTVSSITVPLGKVDGKTAYPVIMPGARFVPLCVEIPVTNSKHPVIGDVGQKVKNIFFKDEKDFDFIVCFSCGGVDPSEGKPVYANPDSKWFNVFFGYYQLNAHGWDRSIGYTKENAVYVDEVLRVAKADWNYFSNYQYGVPEQYITSVNGDLNAIKYAHENNDAPGYASFANRGRKKIGDTWWDVIDVYDFEVVSAYRNRWEWDIPVIDPHIFTWAVEKTFEIIETKVKQIINNVIEYKTYRTWWGTTFTVPVINFNKVVEVVEEIRKTVTEIVYEKKIVDYYLDEDQSWSKYLSFKANTNSDYRDVDFNNLKDSSIANNSGMSWLWRAVFGYANPGSNPSKYNNFFPVKMGARFYMAAKGDETYIFGGTYNTLRGETAGRDFLADQLVAVENKIVEEYAHLGFADADQLSNVTINQYDHYIYDTDIEVSNLTIETEAEVTFESSRRIVFKPGTTIKEGSKFYGKIRE